MPGLGAMLAALGGYNDEAKLTECVGQRIVSLVLVDELNGGDGALVLTLDSGRVFEISDKARSCCESRYLNCDDDLSSLVGQVFTDMNVEHVADIEDGYGCHETAFLRIHSQFDSVTIETHNEHNGYYGGIIVAVTEAASVDPVVLPVPLAAADEDDDVLMWRKV